MKLLVLAIRIVSVVFLPPFFCICSLSCRVYTIHALWINGGHVSILFLFANLPLNCHSTMYIFKFLLAANTSFRFTSSISHLDYFVYRIINLSRLTINFPAYVSNRIWIDMTGCLLQVQRFLCGSDPRFDLPSLIQISSEKFLHPSRNCMRRSRLTLLLSSLKVMDS